MGGGSSEVYVKNSDGDNYTEGYQDHSEQEILKHKYIWKYTKVVLINLGQ